MQFEHVIFSSLVFREDYGRQVIPFLKKDYFSDNNDKVLFDLIEAYTTKYNRFPTQEALSIELEGMSINQSLYDAAKGIIDGLSFDPNTDTDWLVEKTEKFCQEKAVYQAIMQSIQILDNKDGSNDKGSIPKILSDALGVSFDTNIGHDFLENSDQRFEFYHKKESKIPFNIDYLNKITKGGFSRKTLNVWMAMTGGGKSLVMCHCAAGNLLDGKNVLYITMEMSEEKIAERIDANLMDTRVDELIELNKEAYDKKISKIKTKTTGKLIVKEYPTSCAGAANFRHLLNELKLKKKFMPDIIYIDYLNICASSRIKFGASVNSYTYVKSIAEELRGLAVEFDVPIVSATQSNRDSFGASDMDMSNTSESVGLPATVDFMAGIIATEELDKLGQLMFKQLKNRYNDPSVHRRFVVGVDRSRMKLYDCEQSAQENLLPDDDKPVIDKGDFFKSRSKFKPKALDGFA